MKRIAKSLVPRRFSRSCLLISSRTFSQSSNTSHQSNVADFGFKEVAREEKEKLVRNVFSNVATKYDVMNDAMSLGIHRLWKDEFVGMIGFEEAAKIDPEYVPRHLDVAGGTGDIAFRSALELYRCYGDRVFSSIKNSGDKNNLDNKPIIVCDINPEMLSVGKSRAATQVGSDKVDMVCSVGKSRAATQVGSDKVDMLGFVEGNAERLPFADNSFDLYTIAFGLRNVTNKDLAIREAFRVLKKGGRLMILEFSHVPNNLIAQVYDQFSFKLIPKIGKVIADDEASYQYLVESIRRFPKQEELLKMLTTEGFSCCSYVNFTFGVVAVHSGFKL